LATMRRLRTERPLGRLPELMAMARPLTAACSRLKWPLANLALAKWLRRPPLGLVNGQLTNRGEFPMASQASDDRPGFSDLLAELTDSDVVVEAVASAGSRRPPDVAQVQRFQEAVEASYRALAGPVSIQVETVAVLEEIAR